ncbi:hypothetical protein CYJ61_06090 [Gardnerella leopoldii]|uniref:Uncharacterized protein n=1 Tax=Gardnerella vaginalis TaxID=2702 RepID=A0AAP8IRC0_GARVA|nr:hypothetical protein CYJ61_06090 [Gardnerella vaginalis]
MQMLQVDVTKLCEFHHTTVQHFNTSTENLLIYPVCQAVKLSNFCYRRSQRSRGLRARLRNSRWKSTGLPT